MKYNFKKAAMFGLDARIALAIFGALSVISGAALYSAIEKAKTEQYRQYFVELVKASEAYYLDNGTPLPRYTTDPAILQSSDLLQNRENLSTWKGPYISAEVKDSWSFKDNLSKKVNPNTYVVLWQQKSSDWATNTGLSNCVIGDSDCSEYVRLFSGDTAAGKQMVDDIFEKLDKDIDGGDGDLKGIVRRQVYAGNSVHVIYKGFPRVRTI